MYVILSQTQFDRLACCYGADTDVFLANASEQQQQEVLRFNMWSRLLGNEYRLADGKGKKKLKNAYAKQLGTTPGSINLDYETGIISTRTFPLDCCAPTVTPSSIEEMWSTYKKKREEQAMYAQANAAVIQQANPDKAKVDHLLSRLNNAFNVKRNEARKTFKIDDDSVTPKSPKEMVERIKAGEFTFKKDRDITEDGSLANPDMDNYGVCNPYYYISWRTEPADTAGYQAWQDQAKAEKQKVEDTIRVLSPAEGLKALQDFESTTIN